MVSLRQLLGRSPIALNTSVQPWRVLSRWSTVWGPGLASLAVTTTVAGISQLGWLEGLERLAYDQMVRLRHSILETPLDDRLLIVTVTDPDLDRLQEFPLRDGTVATAIAQLQRHDPAVIGLDMYRAIPKLPGRTELLTQLSAENVWVIAKLPDGQAPGIPAPEGVPPERVAFNDVVVDADGILRRTLLMVGQETPTGEVVHFSLALQLALHYLTQQGITPQASAANPAHLQLGPTVFVPLQSGSGGYATIDASGYQVMLTYRDAIAPARQVTLSQLLDGEVNPAWIRDKIVLMGLTAPSFKDLFYTPFTGAGAAETHQMPGVVIHAQMVSQILDAATGRRSLLWTSRPWQEGFLCFICGVLAGALAWRLRHPLTLSLTQSLLLAAVAVMGFGLFWQRGWMPVVAPALTTLGTSGLVLAYQAQQSARQRQMMLVLLGQNTSPEIAQALWENRDRLLKSGKLPGQKTVATMLFTDIRGFSSLAEVTPPEQLLDWLNDYLSAMAETIQAHHGIVNKFTGDGLLAVFGVPIVRHTTAAIAADAEAAVTCALAMTEALAALNQRRRGCKQPPLQMRVGIFTGPVVVGSLGGHTRLEYGIIGDSVNVASRLESLDKHRQPDDCRILIGQETLKYLPNTFQVESWGQMHLKGRHTPIEVFRVFSKQP